MTRSPRSKRATRCASQRGSDPTERRAASARARPGAVIEFTLLEGYAELADLIKAHGYDLARRIGVLPTREEVAADWYDTVYVPALEAVHRASLFELYASWPSTEADKVMWIYRLRRDLRGYDATVDFDAAAGHAAAQAREINKDRRRRRQFRRDGRRPLARS